MLEKRRGLKLGPWERKGTARSEEHQQPVGSPNPAHPMLIRGLYCPGNP